MKALVLVAVLTPIRLIGCARPAYRTFEFKHITDSIPGYDGAVTTRFSFEYPSGYRKTMTYAKAQRGAPIAVRFSHATGAFGCVQADDTVFAVFVDWPSTGMLDARQAADRSITGISPQSYERASTTVAGQPAELVVKSSNAMPTREVFFDYDGRIWEILIYSQSTQADQARLDFDRVIATFRILP